MRKATSVEHVRCAQCRNPIRGRQAGVRHARADLSFHADCWAALHADVQRAYLERVETRGVEALLEPYGRGEGASWSPPATTEAPFEAPIEAPIEAVAAGLTEELGTVAS